MNTPEPSTSSVDSAALVSSISDWTKTNLLSPNFSKSSSSTFSDEGGVNLDYKIIDSTTSLTALSSLYSHLSSLPVNPPPNTCTMLIFSHPFTYDTFSLIDKTLDFSLPLCKDLEGKVITHYHPGFKNAPRLLYVGRHSPYPVFSVTVKSVEEVRVKGVSATMWNSDQFSNTTPPYIRSLRSFARRLIAGRG